MKKGRKCIIKTKYGGIYLIGAAECGLNLYDAKIFKYEEVPSHIKFYIHNEIIFLDTKKGINLINKEIKELDSRIPQLEKELEGLKRGRINLSKEVKRR